MIIYIGSDHAGFELKKNIINYFKNNKDFIIIDIGCKNENKCDYPKIAEELCKKITINDIGILICGSGIGMSIKANRFSHIRCALCYESNLAELSRKHNNANVLALGSRFINYEKSIEILQTFITTKFEVGRHISRINML